MNNEQKLRLDALKAEQQCKQKAAYFNDLYIGRALEVLEQFKVGKVACKLIHIGDLETLYLPCLEPLLGQYTEWRLDLTHFEVEKNLPIVGEMFDRYPGTLPLRYQPDLPDIAKECSDGLRQSAEYLGLEEGTVYMVFLSYLILFEISLTDLLLLENPEIFEAPGEDICIFPKDYSWLITCTIEEDWFAGYYKPNPNTPASHLHGIP